jgi:hypothetical protein
VRDTQGVINIRFVGGLQIGGLSIGRGRLFIHARLEIDLTDQEETFTAIALAHRGRLAKYGYRFFRSPLSRELSPLVKRARELVVLLHGRVAKYFLRPSYRARYKKGADH